MSTIPHNFTELPRAERRKLIADLARRKAAATGDSFYGEFADDQAPSAKPANRRIILRASSAVLQ